MLHLIGGTYMSEKTNKPINTKAKNIIIIVLVITIVVIVGISFLLIVITMLTLRKELM